MTLEKLNNNELTCLFKQMNSEQQILILKIAKEFVKKNKKSGDKNDSKVNEKI